MNNSVFGKTMGNLRKGVDVKLVTDEKKLMKLTSKPSFVTSKIFNEKLVADHKIKETLITPPPPPPPHHNFVVIAPMIMKFGKGIELDVFYTVVTKKFVRSLLLRNYNVITCI